MSQKIIFPSSIPNGANVIFPVFKGKIIGGQVLMDVNSPISGSPSLMGTFYPKGGFEYVRMIRMSMNTTTFSMTSQLAIFAENPDYYVDGTFPLELNVTTDANDSIFLWGVDTSPGQNTFLVVQE